MQTQSTLLDDFLQWEKETPENIFLKQPIAGNWTEFTWSEVGEQARKTAAHLKSKGLQKGDHVGILSKNCAHWLIADLAIMMGGFVSVPFYPNIVGKQLEELIDKSDIKALFVGKLEDFDQQKSFIPKETYTIAFPHYSGNSHVITQSQWNEVLNENIDNFSFELPKRSELWTILFTSGTTGSPKGVMLDFGSISKLLDMERKHNRIGLFQMSDFRFFSYLPLNHIAERAIVEAACLASGGVIYFAESLDKFAENLQVAQPTLFMAVPRIWTKFQQAILSKMSNKKLDFLVSVPIIGKLLKSKLKKALGLNRAELVLTGAAAISDTLKDWYLKLGLELKEVYGMTETCGGGVFMDIPLMRGSVGRPIPEVELRTTDDNEIIMKMPWSMLGYYKDEEKTKEILKDGWIYTGDQGQINEDGSVSITGRVKDAFKSDKGKYILPGPIENKLTESLLIEQICVAGIGLPQPIALILLSEVGICEGSEKVKEKLSENITRLNKSLAKHEQLKKVVILKDDWNVANGLLTPTLKIKRQAVNDKYKTFYKKWYDEKDSIIEINPN